MASWVGQPSVKGGSETVQMILLTFATIGFSFTWSIEQTYCTPYLLNLGLSKSNTSLVWIAGPLSGLVMQPLVGSIADASTSRYGRRRPLMASSSAIVAVGLLVLGFARDIVGGEAGRAAVVLAVTMIYAVDFAINAVMSCSRSLMVDTLPIEKQQAGAAWVSRQSAIGHMAGYVAGAVDLVKLFGPRFGDTQFKQLCVVAAAAVLVSTAVTCWAVTERVLLSPPAGTPRGGLAAVRRIIATVRNLPPRIEAICWAQFWSWIGWFPFLFYSTTWIGETYFRYDVPADAPASDDVLGDVGRVGSTALVLYSTVTFVGAFVLPFLVRSPADDAPIRRPPRALASVLERFSAAKPDLLTAWMCGDLMFAAAMSLAPFATSFRFATVLVCLCGLPWSVASWAPTAFLGIEVNRLSSGSNVPFRRMSNASDIELSPLGSPLGFGDAPMHLEHGPDSGSVTSSTGELSGIYFGILNIYTTIPQFISTLISAIVFAILEPGKSQELTDDGKPGDRPRTDGPNAIAVSLFIGAVCAVVAAYATRRLRVL